MPNSYQLRCDHTTLSLTVSRVDEQVFRVILDRVYPQQLPSQSVAMALDLVGAREQTILLRRILFWAKSDKPKSVPRQRLLTEVTAALAEVERDLDFLTYAYAMSCRTTISVHGNAVPIQSSGAGPIAGIRLNGDQKHAYILHCGVGRCDLQKVATYEPRKGQIVEVIDLRRQESLPTDNLGVIRIKRRGIKTSVPELLSTMAQFLGNTQSDNVQIGLAEEIKG